MMRNRKTAGTLVVLSVAALAATGCGFQLRGNLDLPPELARVYVSGANRDLVDGLSAALAQRGAEVAASVRDAAHIHLVEGDFARRVLTTDPRGRATAYTFRYRVTFRITTAGAADTATTDTSPQATESIVLQRAFDYDPNRELQAEEEVRFLKTEMRREMLQRLLLRLARP